MEIQLGPCPACGKWSATPLQVKPEWASLAGWNGCIRWLRDDEDAPPIPGQLCKVALSYPFRGRRGEAFWCLWESSDVYEGGYEENPEQLKRSRVVEAQLQDVLPLQESDDRDQPVLAMVKVLRCLLLSELLTVPPKGSRDPANIDWLRSVTPSARAGEWCFAEMNVEGDAGCSIIWASKDGVRHLVLEERWGGHESYFFAGHLLAEDRGSSAVSE